MNLRKLHKQLIQEGHNTNSTYLAKSINSTLDLKIAIDTVNNPVLLISEDGFEDLDLTKSNYRLNYLEILFGQNCSIHEAEKNDDITTKRFVTIKLIDGNSRMVEYFLELLEVLVKRIENNPTLTLLNEEIRILIDLFSVQTPVPKNIVLGLWGELFFILQSKDISESVKAWHIDHTNLFDFSFKDNKCVEVKTTTKTQRIHEFSHKQIEKYQSFDVEIASIVTQPSSFGVSIKDLWKEISEKLVEIDLRSKMTRTISITLKSDFQALYDYKYNFEMGKSTIKYINTKLIPSVKQDLHPSIRNLKLTIQLDSI